MGADVERRAFEAVADAAAAALTSVHLATTAKFDSELLARAKEAAWKRDSEGLGGTSEDGSSLPGEADASPERRPASGHEEKARTAPTTRTAGTAGTRTAGTAATRTAGTAARTEQGRDGEEVDPDSNAGLALRWRLCHKRALQRAYRAAAARVEEASGGGGGGRGASPRVPFCCRRAVI